MPVTTLFSSAATLLYAVSALLSGAQNAAVHQGPLMRHTDSFSDASSSPSFMAFNATSEVPSLHINKRVLTPADRVGDFKARARGLVTLLTYRPSPGDKKNNPLSDTDHRQHEQQMAEVIFRQIIAQSFRHNASGPKPDEITYYDKETIATLFLDTDGNVTRCRLIEVIEPEESDRILQMISEKKKLIEKATFRTMLTIITACQGLEPKTSSYQHNNNNLYTEKVNSDHQMPENWMENYNMWTLVSGILPGTKWCGLGDISSSYDDLGPERNLDKCCRAHDHCPIKIKAFRSRYGLVNWSLYTKSHCECDRLLYECLKKASTPTAEMLGNFYFNVLRIQCVDDEEPTMCAARDPATGNCKLLQPDTRQPKRMLFRSVRREF